MCFFECGSPISKITLKEMKLVSSLFLKRDKAKKVVMS